MGKYYIGLDGGSTYLKAALIGNGEVIDTMVRNTGIDNDGTARKLARELCDNNGICGKKYRSILHGSDLAAICCS